MNYGKTLPKDILLLGMFYIIAHGGILLIPNAIFWDDWVIYRASPSTILDTFSQAGSMFNIGGQLHIALLTVGPWTYKVLTFILMFASGFLLNQILKRHTFLTAETRLFVVLLFLVLPFNAARVALIDFPYTLCYFLFFAAWLLMDSHRFIALVLFFLSFNTNSLLVFYALPVLDIMYRGGYLTSLRSSLSFCVHRIDYILLPFVYFFIKTYFFTPYGKYAGYNENYSFDKLIPAATAQREDFRALLNLLISNSSILLLALPLLVFTYMCIKKISFLEKSDRQISWVFLALGSLCFFLGAFPYWILGHTPSFYEWTSRHQLLLPLGSALFIVGGLSFFSNILKTGIMSVVIALSLAINLTNYIQLTIDWHKQTELTRLFSTNIKIQHAGLLVIDDRTTHLNALHRSYRFYEWNGILEYAFREEKRFGIVPTDLEKYLSGGHDSYFTSAYKAGSHRRDAASPVVSVVIDRVEPDRKGGFYERFKNWIFPKFALSVS